MFRADYHLHSLFSFDSEEELENICEKAIEEGLSEIAVTDHADIYTNRKYDNDIDIKAQQRAINEAKEKYAGKLSVIFGIELGQPQMNENEAKRFYMENEFDFIIGSIHNLKNDSDIYYYDFDKLDCDKVYEEYLGELIVLAEKFDFDVMGHITYPLRYMYMYNKKTVDITKYTDEITKLFKLIIEKGHGIEINTSGLRQEIGKTFPDKQTIELYKRCGGEIITVGSDAHEAKDVGSGIKDGYEMLRQCGFKYVASYKKRKVKFNEI
ncbi:MAG: histidinol-phosphatase HisJ family protein [Firmicutes bacterium]|nr:histidinol-phosphatase HisJ family protein [Bacillota bacterium]